MALEIDGQSLTYRELAAAAGTHAARVRELGIRPGDTVAIIAHGDLATLTAIVGNAEAGVVTIPVNPKLGATELAHVLADGEPRCVMATSTARQPFEPSALGTVRFEPLEVPGTDGKGRVLAEVSDRPLLLLYTSGTTGAPKGVPLTSRNVSANLDGLAEAWAITDRDRIVHALPMFHVHGLVLGALGALRSGATLLHRSRFEVADLAATLVRGTVLFAVPTMYHRLAGAAEGDASIREALRGARLLVSGSAALSPLDRERIERATGRSVLERYGATESLIACAAPARAPARAGSVGPPVPGVVVELVDEQGAAIPASDVDAIGEVIVKGPSVFAGYRNRPEASAEALVDGWYRTSDLATRDADGWLRIVGRRSTDLIKSGGFKLGAGEIETALLGHPAVAECAVVGRPDSDLGERVVAFVVLRDGTEVTPDALVDHVTANLAPHKRPREVHFVEGLPRNALGKVQKKLLP